MFVILTDGCIHDMQETKKLIVEIYTLPISFIVGIGNIDFAKMNKLNKELLSNSN